jgi:TolA-binding protein
MNKSILALTLALGLSAGLATIASADPIAAAPQQQTQTDAVWDYNHNVNPEATVHSTGPYDQEDLYRGANGNPLPGDNAIFGESGLDNN